MPDEYDDLLNSLAPKPSPQPRRQRPTASHLDVLTQFAQDNKLTVGSTTGGRHNRGSLHYSGNAIDIKGSGAFDDATVQRLTREAQARGLKLRDERRRPAGQKVWGGPHVHLEYAGVGDDYDSLLDSIAAPTATAPPIQPQFPSGTTKGRATGRPELVRPRRQQPQGQVESSGLGAPPIAMADFLQRDREMVRQGEDQRKAVRQQVRRERMSDAPTLQRRFAQGMRALGPMGTPILTAGQELLSSEDELVNQEIERRLASQRLAETPEVVEGRKEFGSQAAPIRALTMPAGRAGAGLVKTLAGLSSFGGIAPNEASEYLNKRAEVLEQSASLAPLDAQGQEIERGIAEKGGGAVLDVGFTVAQLIAMKKATGLSLSKIMMLETALRTSDQPVKERAAQVAQAGVMGKALDVQMSRAGGAAANVAPTLAQEIPAVAVGQRDPYDAAINTAVQAGTGALLTSPRKRTPLQPMPDAVNREAAPPLRPSELQKRVALREGANADSELQRRSSIPSVERTEISPTAQETAPQVRPRPEARIDPQTATPSAVSNIPRVVEGVEPLRGVTRAQTETQTTLRRGAIVGYHGTNAEFKEFRPSPTYGDAYFFLSRPDFARSRARVITAELELKNPFHASGDTPITGAIQQAKKRGHDGVVVDRGDRTEYVVFSTKQIRQTGEERSPRLSGGVNEIKTETQPNVETQLEGKESAVTPKGVPVQSVENRSVVAAPTPVDTAPGLKSQWQHRDFGKVVEADSQAGVGRGRVRVVAEDGSEHVIQRPKGTGAGNQIAIPVREAAPETPVAVQPKGMGVEVRQIKSSGEWMVVDKKTGDALAFFPTQTEALAYKPQLRPKKPSPLSVVDSQPEVVKVFRGESQGMGDKAYYTIDKEWARQFTQSGRATEVRSSTIPKSDIYRKDPLPRATSEAEFDAAIAEAKQKGFSAVWFDEGAKEPPSIYVVDKSVLGRRKGRSVQPEAVKPPPSVAQRMQAKDRKDYTQKVNALEGYLSLDKQRAEVSDKMLGYESDHPQYRLLDKKLDEIDRALNLEVEQATKRFGVGPDDFISLVNDFESNKASVTAAMMWPQASKAAPPVRPAAEGGQKPPQSASKGSEKQPWEMTREEFRRDLEPQWYTEPKHPVDWHREVVKTAISEGKSVPPEVLRDYPDLQPTTPAGRRPEPAAVNPAKGGAQRSDAATPSSARFDMKAQFKRAQVIDALSRDEHPYRGWEKDYPDLAAERLAGAAKAASSAARDAEWETVEIGRSKSEADAEWLVDVSVENRLYRKEGTDYVVYEDRPRVPPLKVEPVKPPPVEVAKAPEPSTAAKREQAVAGDVAARPLSSIRDATLANRPTAQSGTTAPPIVPLKRGELSLPKTLEKAGLPGGKERFYDVKTNVESENAAKQIIKERGIEGARNWVQAGEQPTVEQSATAVELIKGLAKEAETAPADVKAAKLTQAGDLASNMAVRAKEAGQFNQYLATLAKESPEGVLYYAESRIKRQSPDARLTAEQRNGMFDTAVKLKATEAELEAARTKLADVEKLLSERAIRPRGQREPQVTKRLRDWADQAEKDARARLATRTGVKGSQAGASTIPADIADYAVIGAAKIARGTADFAAWSSQMVSEFGEDIRPQLRRIRAESERLVNEQSQLAKHGKAVDEIVRLAKERGFDASAVDAANKFVRGMSRTDFHREAMKSGLNRQQAHDLAVEGYKLYSEANRSLRQAGKERRAEKDEPDATPARKAELIAQRDALMRQRAKERRELASMMKQIEEGRPSVYRRLNNQFRGVIVSALQTASRNITTQVPRVVVEDMTKAFELSFVKGKAKLGWKLKEGDIDPRTRMLDTFKSSAYLLQRNKRITEGILDEFPVEYEQMFRRFSSDVDITPQTGISKGVHKGLDKIDKAIEIVNTPNRFQEFLVRRAVFRGELEASLRAEGVDLNKIVAEGRQGEIDRAKVQKAVNEALRVTFADSPARGTAGDHFISFTSSLPAPINPLTFSRFLYNGAKFTLEYQPTTALRGLYRTARGKPGAASDYAKAAVGTVMLTTAVQVYDNLHKEGSEWYLLDLPGVGEIDIRPYQPFASYIFASHWIRTKQSGRPISYEGTRVGNIGTYVEGLTGLSARPVPVYEVAKAAASESQEWDGVLRQIKRVGGETVAGLLTPLKTPKQIIAQFDEQEAIVRDASQAPFTGPIRRNIPFASRSLPPLVRNEEVVTQPIPALQLAGVRTVMPDKRSEAEKFAQKLLRRDYTEARTDEEITRGKQTADLRARARRGETVDLSVLPPRQRASIEKSKGMTRPEETFKRLGLEDLLKVWESNTPTATEREQIIKPLLADKADAVDQLDESKQAAVKAQLRAIGIVPVEELPADKQREIVSKRRLESREQARARREKQRGQPRQRPSLGYGY